MDAPIASAVVLPDDPQEPASPRNGHKRRQSSVSEENAKRPRLDGDETPTQQPGSTNGASPAPPAPPARREAGRERRLFGAALGALSQNSTTTAQRRRAEIEKRQLAKRKREDEESDQKKAERAAKRKAQRLKEQEAFERDTVCGHCCCNVEHTLTIIRCDCVTRAFLTWHTSSRPKPVLIWSVFFLLPILP